MKHIIKILFILFFFLLIFSLFEGNITSRFIFSGKAPYAQTAVTVFIDTEPPEIYIDSPTVNASYTVNTIPLKFTILDDISSIDTILYNLDNTANITITGNTTFYAAKGDHILYMYANDTAGHLNNTESVPFTVLTAIPVTKGVPSKGWRPIMLPVPIRKPGKFFDALITIPEKYRTLAQGEELIAEITLINMQKIGLVDVRVDYYIKDLNDKTLYHEYETKGVERTITYLKEFDTSSIDPGTYMLIMEVKYNSDLAIAGYPITITEKTHLERPISFISSKYVTYIIIAILIIFAIAFYYQHKKIKKLGIKKISAKELRKMGYIKRR